MGQEYNLKLFYETGFDRYNRPDSLGASGRSYDEGLCLSLPPSR